MWQMAWEWLWYTVPWWVKIPVGLGIALVVWRLVGTKWAIVAGAVIFAALGYNKAAQAGWKAKEQRDMKDADKLIQKASQARSKAEKLAADPRHLRDDDGFRRD